MVDRSSGPGPRRSLVQTLIWPICCPWARAWTTNGDPVIGGPAARGADANEVTISHRSNAKTSLMPSAKPLSTCCVNSPDSNPVARRLTSRF